MRQPENLSRLLCRVPVDQPQDQDADDDAWTGTAKYQFSVSDDLMVYGSYDRGWRAGSATRSGRGPATWR